MNRLMGVIHLDGEQDLLKELTYFRCGAAVPFGGRYRIIDFVLSNMVHSRIQDIAVFTRQKYRSLLDHLDTGKSWDLNRKRGGLYILPPDWNDPTDLSKGELQHFHNNRDFFDRGFADYVLITGTQHICSINYQDILREHLDTGADVTMIYHPTAQLDSEHRYEKKLEIDSDGLVTAITNDATNSNLYMGMFIIRKKLLMEIVDNCIARQKEHLLLDGIFGNLDRLVVRAHAYTGYHALINSIESYYKHSMNLLKPEHFQQLFTPLRPVYTKVKDEAPTCYRQSYVHNSLIANGCVIEGTVENSILFRGVHVHKDAVIRNSIVMQRCDIHEGALVENSIIDKDSIISVNRTVVGVAEYPYLLAKRNVI